VIYSNDEGATLEIRAPLAQGLNEPIELAFVGGELGVEWGELATKECDWPSALVQHPPTPVLEASHSTTKSLVKSGSCRTGADVRAHYSARNATSASVLHRKPSLWRRRVNGTVASP
jgi:hypothetical protein